MEIRYCDFKNQWMTEPCGKKCLNDGGEPYCLDHGTRKFVIRASDLIGVNDSTTNEARNSGASWTDDDVVQLIQFVEEALSIDEIAELLGRSKNAVYNKIWNLTKEDE